LRVKRLGAVGVNLKELLHVKDCIQVSSCR
jgi:hypothetical protein